MGRGLRGRVAVEVVELFIDLQVEVDVDLDRLDLDRVDRDVRCARERYERGERHDRINPLLWFHGEILLVAAALRRLRSCNTTRSISSIPRMCRLILIAC